MTRIAPSSFIAFVTDDDMTSRIEQFAPALRLLHRYDSARRKRWIKHNLADEFVFCLCECAKNLLKGNVPLTHAQKKTLSRRKKELRELARKKVSLKKKRKIVQSGGILGTLLGPIISVLGGLFGGQN